MKTTILAILLAFPTLVFADIPPAKDSKVATQKAQVENFNRQYDEVTDWVKVQLRESIKKGLFEFDMSVKIYQRKVVEKIIADLKALGYDAQMIPPENTTNGGGFILRVRWE